MDSTFLLSVVPILFLKLTWFVVIFHLFLPDFVMVDIASTGISWSVSFGLPFCLV